MKRLIRASAGSGKTFQLSGHFLRQLFLGHRPETILATTFTRKAAGEILGRVLLRLAAAASNPAEAAKLSDFLQVPSVSTQSAQELLTSVTRSLHRLRVCTLDSFFQQVARSLTLELGLPPGWSIVDEHTDRELREQAIDAVLSQHVPEDAQQLMQMLAKGRSRRSVRDLIDETVTDFHELFLLTSEDAWDQLPKVPRLTAVDREQLLRDLYAAPLPVDNRFIKARSEDVGRFQAELWDEFIDKGLAAKVLAGDPKYYGKTLNDEIVAIYQRLLSHAKAELLERLALQMKAIRNLISRFDREYDRLRAEHGWLRFGDVTRVLARSASAASGQRMSFRLDSSIRNLLLDEFQDTSADQWQILKRLTKTLQRESDSSFFCVGDGKQAIYGWRGGVAEILDAVEHAVPGIGLESLDTSRRSSPAVIAAVNQIFTHVANHPTLDDYHQECSRWSTRFPQHSTAHSDMPGYVGFRTSPLMDGETAEERRVPWYRWVAEQIRDLHQQSPGAEIGVLTRRNSTVARLVHELTQLQVAASEEGGTPPTDSPALLAFLSLLQMASHPGCEASRFHVATSPLGAIIGLTDWNNLKQATQVAAALRAQLMDEGYGRTLQWLSESIREFCSARDLLRLQQVVAQGWAFDDMGSLNPGDFVRLLENSKFQKSEPAPVRVMTIHQSKGLEFDIVVLPELDTQLFQSPQAAFTGPGAGDAPDRVCVWSRKSLRPMLPQPLQQAFDDTISRQVAEGLCVFYVAVTRAKHAMHLLTPPMTNDKPPKTYAGLLLASLATSTQAPPSTTVYEAGDPEWYRHVPELQTAQTEQLWLKQTAPPRVRLSPMPDGRRRGIQRRAPSRHDETRLYLPDVSAMMARREQPDAATRKAAVKSLPIIDARTRGTVLHAWFECVEWLEAGTAVDLSLLRQRAAEQSVPVETVEVLLPDFLKMLELPEVRKVFDRSGGGFASVFQAHQSLISSGAATLKVQRERAFVYLHNGELVLGSIDRLVLLKSGGRVVAADIVDFKTDRLVGPRDQWLEARRTHYAPQLQEYRAAVSHSFGLEQKQISARLLLLEAGTVVETQ
jgi:ATP-dependent helicase/nuclease subunit A